MRIAGSTIGARYHAGRVGLVLAFALLAGCGDSVGLGEQIDLASAEARWARHGSPDYSYILAVSCFCPIESPMRITVRADTVAGVVVLHPPPPGWPDNAYHGITVPELFAVIRQALISAHADVKVSYDPDFGFPRALMIDWDGVMGNDDEVAYALSEYTREPAH